MEKIIDRFFILLNKVAQDFSSTTLTEKPRLKWENMNLATKMSYFDRNLFTAIRKITAEKIKTRQDVESNIRYLEGALLDYIYFLFAAGLDGLNWKRCCSCYAQFHLIVAQYYRNVDQKESIKHHLFSAVVFSAIADNSRIWRSITNESLVPAHFSRIDESVLLIILEGCQEAALRSFSFGEDNWSLLLTFVKNKDTEGIERTLKLLAEEDYDQFELGKYVSGDPSFNPIICALTAYLRMSGLLTLDLKKLTKKHRTVLSAGLLSELVEYAEEL